MNLIGYTRVSTAEQAQSGLGLAAQRSAIEARFPKKGPDTVVFFEDAGFSGSLPPERRPNLSKALDLLHHGKADGLVVAKLDRLARSVMHFTELVERSAQEGWTLVILDLGVDTSTSNGKFLANIIASVAQLERDLIKERTAAAMQKKRDGGWRHPNQTPEDVTSVIQEFYREGHTYQSIADNLNSAGIDTPGRAPQWRPQTVRSVLISTGDVTPGVKRTPARRKRDTALTT